MVSGFSKQTVARQGSSAFCESKSSEGSRERVESLERKERVCGECPTPMLTLIEKRGLKLITQHPSPSAVTEQLPRLPKQSCGGQVRGTGNSSLVLFKPFLAKITPRNEKGHNELGQIHSPPH